MVTTKKSTAASRAHEAHPGNSGSVKLVPASPESSVNAAKKRKRLAKVFPRPLEKKLRQKSVVREKFAIPALEYDQLLELKARLAGLGVTVKKSEIVRAGLAQISELDDDALKLLLAKLPATI